MGEVVRPAAFARAAAQRPIPDSPSPRRRHKVYRINRQLLAIGVAALALCWILTLAGAAFAVRTTLLLFFATLAGRARRVGVPVYAPIRVTRKRR